MNNTYFILAKLFSLLSLIAFGGGNVIFPSIHQAAVHYHWMTDRQFLDIFSISKAAPGPTTLLVELVAMKAVAFAPNGDFSLIPAITAALISIIAIFIPSSLLLLFVLSIWKKIQGTPWQVAIQNALMPVTSGLILASTWIIAEPAITGWMTAIMALGALFLLLFTKINPVLIMLVGGLISWALWR